jgi:methylated-DNA-[protein]-cysteine S-methyltransferase
MTEWADVMWRVVKSPVGELLLAGDGRALTAVYFHDHRAPRKQTGNQTGKQNGQDARPAMAGHGAESETDPVLAAATIQLGEYFARTRQEFELPLGAHGTLFQHRVWAALRQIPYGQTATYGDIARRLDLGPAAARAIGLANGANPLSIVVPCHRVIGADGTLTGYGGGLHRKQFLLDLERDQLF